MIIETVRVSFTPNKWPQAVEWGKKITASLKRRHGSLLRPRTGDRNSIVWITQYSSMSEMEDTREKERADSGHMAIVKEGTTADWYLGIKRNYWDVLEVIE